MNIKTKIILATAAVALLSAPASARIDGDDSHAAAYPGFTSQSTYTTDAASAYASGNPVPVQPQQRLRQSQPRR